MSDFRNWLIFDEASVGYAIAGLGRELCILLEARRKKGKRDPQRQLFAPETEAEEAERIKKHQIPPEEREKPEIWEPPMPEEEESCPITPLSGYAKHIGAIQAFAMANPENFAQVMMFSPLSANVPFPKHWDNFYMLMTILKHQFPDKVTPQEIDQVAKAFGDYQYAMPHTISGWKVDTIADIWNNRHKLYTRLPKVARKGDDADLIRELVKIKGIQPVKAGFMAQLLFGRAGCIDTHNVDIYRHVFPELKKLMPKGSGEDPWNVVKTKLAKGAPPEKIQRYIKLLKELEKRGIGTQQLWDVWVDFVESFYEYMNQYGIGPYAKLGQAIDPEDPHYKELVGKEVLKQPPAGREGGKPALIPVIGKGGMGASATHLQLDPDEMYRQLYRMYRMGIPASQAAASIPFKRLGGKEGEPLEKAIGMGREPSLLHYFGKSGEELDPDFVRWIIKGQLAKGGRDREKEERLKKAARRKAELERYRGGLFGEW